MRTQISVRVVSAFQIDRSGLHRSNLAALRAVLGDLHPPADACLVDGFRLGPTAPPHRALVDGDARSAAIAAASIVAKVVRDRVMRRLDAVYPRYGFMSHVGYITPAHSRAVRVFGASALHRRLVPGRLLRGSVNQGERRALRHYRLRGYRLVDANARAGGYELDLVMRRGRRLVVVEVKEKAGAAFGHPLEMIDAEKTRRVSAWQREPGSLRIPSSRGSTSSSKLSASRVAASSAFRC